jgi:hypothetical protein
VPDKKIFDVLPTVDADKTILPVTAIKARMLFWSAPEPVTAKAYIFSSV